MGKKPTAIFGKWFLVFYAVSTLVAGDCSAQEKPPTIQEARKLIKDKKAEKAVKILEPLSVGQTAPEARFLLASIQAGQGKTKQAIAAFRYVANLHKGTEWAALSLEQIAALESSLKNPKAAEDARAELLKVYPASAPTVKFLSEAADAQFKVKKYREALDYWSKLGPKINPQQTKKITIAKALISNAADAPALLQAADQAFEENDIESSRALYQAAIAADKASGDVKLKATVNLGWSWYVEGTDESVAKAQELWSSVIKTGNPKNDSVGQARWHMAQLLAGPLSKWQEAVIQCDAISRDFPKQPRQKQALFTKAWILWGQQQNEAALKAFNDLIAAFPTSADHGPIQYYIQDCKTRLEAKTQE